MWTTQLRVFWSPGDKNSLYFFDTACSPKSSKVFTNLGSSLTDQTKSAEEVSSDATEWKHCHKDCRSVGCKRKLTPPQALSLTTKQRLWHRSVHLFICTWYSDQNTFSVLHPLGVTGQMWSGARKAIIAFRRRRNKVWNSDSFPNNIWQALCIYFSSVRFRKC